MKKTLQLNLEKIPEKLHGQTNIHKFHCNHSGIKISISYSTSVLNLFQLSCSENLINSIVGTTNDYRSSIDEDANTLTSRNTSLLEIYCFLAMKLLMSRNKKLSYREYWSNDELLKNKIFGELICRDRFLYLTIFSWASISSCEKQRAELSVASPAALDLSDRLLRKWNNFVDDFQSFMGIQSVWKKNPRIIEAINCETSAYLIS